jgi:hypothetical protein
MGQRLEEYRERLAADVDAKDRKLKEEGVNLQGGTMV